MASPAPNASYGGWNSNGQTMAPNSNEPEESGLQVRPMGLKVHYTFDKEAKVNCLARPSHTFQVQTISIDDRNSIGIIDLRLCLRAIFECSPELAGQDGDYTVYAVDYSEPETPLVGQGLMSWALESMRNEYWGQPSKMVTGRVAKNLLAVFSGGNRELLEVRLKLSASAKVYRPESQASMDMQPNRPMEQVTTPSGTAEWNNFIQSNPQIGRSGHVSRVASPALSQATSITMNRRDSFGPVSQPMPQQEIQRIAPVPVDPSTVPAQPAASSRPSSRSSRRRAPTGRPRGRPRKKPVEGNTSGYEDGTEGEEGPSKKRAKTTKVEKATTNPFGAGPESLRVAASTSGSIRTFRPIAVNNEGAAGSHLQEVPRAPTPVPEAPLSKPGRASNVSKLRRNSVNQHASSNIPNKPGRALSPSQEDGRSPESQAPTPNYSEASIADIGSSPPVPRAAPFMRSSPPPSSPILPPMPQQQLPQDSGFMSADVDDLFDEEALRPLRETLQSNPLVRPAVEATDQTGVPTQVFQMQNGPNGQDLVHIRNYNTPHPTSTPAAPPTEPQTLPPLEKKLAKQSRPSPPALAPTPPPTTDAIEKIASPAPVEPTPEPTQSTELIKDSGVSEDATESENVVTEPLKVDAPKINPKPSRHLVRSQSAGPLAFPSVPASEPIGPSSLSQAATSEDRRPGAAPYSATLRRSNSTGPLNLTIPASDPAGPSTLALHLPGPGSSETPCPPGDTTLAPSSPVRSNKNLVKKQSIKLRLEEAVQNGEMPPFCTNCGAIETPTWRKIWVQDRKGVPEYFEYSEKPGKVTAIDVLERDDDERPTSHRLIKKSLGVDDKKAAWEEKLLCNPCGIWLVKCKSHRPRDRWDKDAARLGQERRKRGVNGPNSRAKKPRTKSDAQANPTSEAYPLTDPLGFAEPSSPIFADIVPSRSGSRPESQGRESRGPSAPLGDGEPKDEPSQSRPGSTHSQAIGTAKSPIEVDLDEQLGSTRRVLFPTPRKEGGLKVLGEVDVNIVQTAECRLLKALAADKENMAADNGNKTQNDDDELEALFRSPAIPRPSTPPPNAKSVAQTELFKTPTRPTPSHRPITRSVSRSLRSGKSLLSPGDALTQRTPTKTPRGSLVVPGSAILRRSPRNQDSLGAVFDSPISRTISQLLSEPNFDMNSHDLDLHGLPAMTTGPDGLIDFGNLLSTDAALPSSPSGGPSTVFDYAGSANIWAQWSLDHSISTEEDQK